MEPTLATRTLIRPPMVAGVQTGRPCLRYHDGTLKRLVAPAAVRRAVAVRYGAIAGLERSQPALCQYCPAVGGMWWPPLASGRPGSWVHFRDLSLDHVVPYSRGGSTRDPENFVLACKSCNSSKGFRDVHEWLASR